MTGEVGAEKNFENRVKRILETYKIYPLGGEYKSDIEGYYEKRWGGGYFTKKGLPDLHITYRGVSVEVELKSDVGRPSELQKRTLEQINRAECGTGLLIRPANLYELITTLEKIKQTSNSLKYTKKGE